PPAAWPFGAAGSEAVGVAEASLISEMGSLMERWGLPQATGRLFGYLLLRNKPVDLDTMTRELGQAKSGLSVAARQLEAWALVRRSTRRSEEHTSELPSRENLVCRLLLEKTKYLSQ